MQSYESGESRILLDTCNHYRTRFWRNARISAGRKRAANQTLNTLADVVTVLYELNKKQELHFDIDITHERYDDGNFTTLLH